MRRRSHCAWDPGVSTVSPMKPALAVALSASAVLAAGCGSSNSDATAQPAATSTAAPATTTAAPAAAAPTAVNDGKLAVTAKDFSFDAKDVQAKAGKLTVNLTNAGPSPHEFVLLKSSADPGALPVKGGRVSEDASVGEIPEIDGGAKGRHTFDLKPGAYVFVCNIPGTTAAGCTVA